MPMGTSEFAPNTLTDRQVCRVLGDFSNIGSLMQILRLSKLYAETNHQTGPIGGYFSFCVGGHRGM
jgi:hypothetical protein